MASIDALNARMDKLLIRVREQNTPRVIRCDGARDALLTKLLTQEGRADEHYHEPMADWDEFCVRFKTQLATLVRETETAHNVRFE